MVVRLCNGMKPEDGRWRFWICQSNLYRWWRVVGRNRQITFQNNFSSTMTADDFCSNDPRLNLNYFVITWGRHCKTVYDGNRYHGRTCHQRYKLDWQIQNCHLPLFGFIPLQSRARAWTIKLFKAVINSALLKACAFVSTSSDLYASLAGAY